MAIETVNVPLGDRSYDVLIGRGLVGEAGQHIGPLLHRSHVAIVTEENVGEFLK